MQLTNNQTNKMDVSEHTGNFIQEMNRRNYSQNTIDSYVGCLNIFFKQCTKDHPKNINISHNHISKIQSPLTQINLW